MKQYMVFLILMVCSLLKAQHQYEITLINSSTSDTSYNIDVAMRELNAICSVLDIPNDFTLVSTTDYEGAQAKIVNGEKCIIYNPYFMDDIRQKSKTRFATTGVIAHEVEHHRNGDTAQIAHLDRLSQEILADYGMAKTLHLMGATLKEAQSVIETFEGITSHRFENGHYTITHPTKNMRLDFVKKGWESIK